MGRVEKVLSGMEMVGDPDCEFHPELGWNTTKLDQANREDEFQRRLRGMTLQVPKTKEPYKK